jgi:hypothetical protein
MARVADQRGLLTIQAEAEAPIWFINHFLEVTSSNYLKIVSLRKICQAFSNGAADNDFKIAAHSFELIPRREPAAQDYGDVVILESKGHSAARFWRLFGNLQRPIVLHRRGSTFAPIFDPLSEDDALEIKSLSASSPINVELSGAVGALIDLVTGKLFAQRDNERVSIALQNVRDIVETSHLIENAATPDGVRRFAIHQLEGLMNRQYRINRKLGIRRAEVATPGQHGTVLEFERPALTDEVNIDLTQQLEE